MEAVLIVLLVLFLLGGGSWGYISLARLITFEMHGLL